MPKSRLFWLLATGCVVSLVHPLTAQTPPRAAFEVASIKPNTSTERGGLRLQPGGRFTTVGLTLRDLIRLAYGGRILLLPGQVVGGPAWLGSDRFDVVAKAAKDFGPPPSDGGPPTELVAMLRTLLEDRCKVKVHLETRELPTYELVLARSDKQPGPQLRRSAGDCIRPEAATAAPPSPPDPSRVCGAVQNNLNGVMAATAVPMEVWATVLANLPAVGRVVRDRTGLTGEFDVRLEFVPAFLQNPNPGGSAIPNPAADSGPNLFTALQEQLGLKLDSTKAPVDVLVIDHAEKPTED